MTSKIHGNEMFLRSLSQEELEILKQEAATLSKGHEAALKEQLERLLIK